MPSHRRGLVPVGVVITLAVVWAAAAGLACPPKEFASSGPAVADFNKAPSVTSLRSDRPIDYVPSFGQDVRQARKPRPRSDRPTTQSIEPDSTVTAILSMVDIDRSSRQLLFTSSVLIALAGHPAEILRPPSRLA